ncbi:CsgG/HfaB family protein [Azonexus sp.]|uniref:CsgG/HfaB family protein n=1 Tax=Azonexus sp. TaxID=1872668 RepID=UPI0035B3D47B
MRLPTLFLVTACCAAIAGCASSNPAATRSPASLAPPTHVSRDLTNLPEPRGKIPVAIYGFRDQTGQYKPSPDSSFSTSVTQGAASMLIKAVRDSRWFIPVERENLQNLLTERKIVRALEQPQDKAAPGQQIPPLMPANLILEGSIIGFESNVKTGGAGIRYFGIGISDSYRVDQVTVNLRAVDIRTGQIVESVTTTKTVYSIQLDGGGYRFISLKRLLEFEAGFTENEPVQLCVREAIETGLVHLIVQGIRDKSWVLRDEAEIQSPLIQSYLKAFDEQLQMTPQEYAAKDLPQTTTASTSGSLNDGIREHVR